MGAGREVEHEANPCSESGEMLSGRRGRDAVIHTEADESLDCVCGDEVASDIH